MRVEIVIVESLKLEWIRWMVQKKVTLVKIVAND